MRVALVLVTVALAGAACAQNEPAEPLPPVVERTEEESPSPRPQRSPTPPPQARVDALEVALEPFVSGLEAPLLVTHAGDGSRRLFVLEQPGRIRVIADGRVLDQPFLDITSKITSGGEQGLLGLAFHPAYEDNGRFFVNYTDLNGDTVVAEYSVDRDDPNRADAASERTLLSIAQPFPNHNGGHLAFGPDGLLYVATGDGGSGGDPEDNGQSLDTLLGKLLRLDVDVEGELYGAPSDNPFVDDDDARPEIWAYGLRNPWRFSFDRATGDVWIGDVGQDNLEEIDTAPSARAGINYGWNVMEGDACFEPPEGCDTTGLHVPVAVYGRDDGCSVTGGFVYRGMRFPEMNGAYFYGDFCSGKLWALSAARPADGAELLLETGISISSFGEDESGELYITDLSSGQIYRLVAG